MSWWPRLGPLELLMYAVVAVYFAACIHIFSGILAYPFGVELLVLIAGLAGLIWLVIVSTVVPALARHVAVFEAARGVSKAGSGIREWGRSQRERVDDENRRETDRERWREYR